MKSKLYIFLMLLIIGCTSIIENNFSEKSKIDIERLNLIEKLITKDIKKNNLPGAVVLVGDEKGVVYQKAFGIKNPDTKERYTTDDIFRIASMTKAITSIAILKLWENGKISLDDPIDKLSEKDMIWAKYPDDFDILEVGVRGLYIGNFFKFPN